MSGTREKTIQIHHIDEDSSKSFDLANLAVLCLECHQLTMLHGGFGRKLDAAQVRLYKTDWENRVRKRRELIDTLTAQTRANQADYITNGELWHKSVRNEAENQICKLISKQ